MINFLKIFDKGVDLSEEDERNLYLVKLKIMPQDPIFSGTIADIQFNVLAGSPQELKLIYNIVANEKEEAKILNIRTKEVQKADYKLYRIDDFAKKEYENIEKLRVYWTAFGLYKVEIFDTNDDFVEYVNNHNLNYEVDKNLVFIGNSSSEEIKRHYGTNYSLGVVFPQHVKTDFDEVLYHTDFFESNWGGEEDCR